MAIKALGMLTLTSITMEQVQLGCNLQVPEDMGLTLILRFNLLNGIFENKNC